MAFALDTAVTVEGTLLRVRFQRADGWSPGDFLLSESRKQTTAVGQWLGVEPGARVRLLGEWQTHPKYGRQFKFSSCEPLEIDKLDDVAAFLAYRVEEIGEHRAEKISKHFGAELLSILETDPVRLAEVPGISERLATKVGAAFKSYKAEYELLRGLSKWNLTTLVRKRALREWGFRAPQVLEDDVFNLLLLDGVGFQIADKAREVAGISPTDPRRLAAGATCFQQTGVESEGSTWIDYDGLTRGVVELVRCTPREAAVGIASALAKGSLKAAEGGSLVPPEDTVDTRRFATASIFSAKAYDAEQRIARFVQVAEAKSTARQFVPPSEPFRVPPAFQPPSGVYAPPGYVKPPRAARFIPEVSNDELVAIDVEEVDIEDSVPVPVQQPTRETVEATVVDRTGEPPSLEDVVEARAAVASLMLVHDILKLPPMLGVQLPNIDRCLAVVELALRTPPAPRVATPLPPALSLPASAGTAFPRLIQELAATDSVVHRLVSLVEQNAEADLLYEAFRMELDATLRRVRDSLLDYLRDGDESAKEQFSLMVERLTAIAVVSTQGAVLAVLGKARLEKPVSWRAE